MLDDVGGDAVEPLLGGDEVVLLTEEAPELLLLVLVQRGVLEDLLEVAVERVVGEL